MVAGLGILRRSNNDRTVITDLSRTRTIGHLNRGAINDRTTGVLNRHRLTRGGGGVTPVRGRVHVEHRVGELHLIRRTVGVGDGDRHIMRCVNVHIRGSAGDHTGVRVDLQPLGQTCRVVLGALRSGRAIGPDHARELHRSPLRVRNVLAMGRRLGILGDQVEVHVRGRPVDSHRGPIEQCRPRTCRVLVDGEVFQLLLALNVDGVVAVRQFLPFEDLRRRGTVRTNPRRAVTRGEDGAILSSQGDDHVLQIRTHGIQLVLSGIVTIGQHRLAVDAHTVRHALGFAIGWRSEVLLGLSIPIGVRILVVGNAVAVLVVGHDDERIRRDLLSATHQHGLENVAVLHLFRNIESLTPVEVGGGGDFAFLEDIALGVTPLDPARQRRESAGHLQLSRPTARHERFVGRVVVRDVELDIGVVHSSKVDVVETLERAADQTCIVLHGVDRGRPLDILARVHELRLRERRIRRHGLTLGVLEPHVHVFLSGTLTAADVGVLRETQGVLAVNDRPVHRHRDVLGVIGHELLGRLGLLRLGQALHLVPVGLNALTGQRRGPHPVAVTGSRVEGGRSAGEELPLITGLEPHISTERVPGRLVIVSPRVVQRAAVVFDDVLRLHVVGRRRLGEPQTGALHVAVGEVCTGEVAQTTTRALVESVRGVTRSSTQQFERVARPRVRDFSIGEDAVLLPTRGDEVMFLARSVGPLRELECIEATATGSSDTRELVSHRLVDRRHGPVGVDPLQIHRHALGNGLIAGVRRGQLATAVRVDDLRTTRNHVLTAGPRGRELVGVGDIAVGDGVGVDRTSRVHIAIRGRCRRSIRQAHSEAGRQRERQGGCGSDGLLLDRHRTHLCRNRAGYGPPEQVHETSMSSTSRPPAPPDPWPLPGVRQLPPNGAKRNSN